ncbi:endopeptidase La [Mycoplasma sp. NEAQ87857]|uniref:endopeptidase La n=1 Tax=Mycoplasma sp. NEAQ87857 TaxID=2683967 RepID=UPI00131735AF|nr:endopeptidase La [Mycoplasma sp. NEAQ87857]QGZ97696.1 endopeptidase La [Mycoplasma sp. NEAQ87857]
MSQTKPTKTKKIKFRYIAVPAKECALPLGYHMIILDQPELIKKITQTQMEEARMIIVYLENDGRYLHKAAYVQPLSLEALDTSDSKSAKKWLFTYKSLGFVELEESENHTDRNPTAQKAKEYDEFVVFKADKFQQNSTEFYREVLSSLDLDTFHKILKATLDTIERDDTISSLYDEAIDQYRAISYKGIGAIIDTYEHKLRTNNHQEFQAVYFASVLNFFNQRIYPDRERVFFDFSIDNLTNATYNISNVLNQFLEIETEIKDKINTRLNEQQKEFILREKMKAISDSLKSMNVDVDDEDQYSKIIRDDVLNKIYPKSVQKLIKVESKRASEMMQASPEANIVKTYVSLLKQLPWRKTEVEYLDIDKVRSTLDKYHYGIDEVKQRIIEYIALIIKAKQADKDKDNKLPIDAKHEIDLSLFKEENKNTYNNVPIITLVGPPGTGKTSLSKAIAEALNRKFIKVSLGGVHDESEIRGHRRTYVGAMPGKIVKGIKRAGVSNPVILLDEIDKMASNTKGDPASAMLEVLDPEQNSKFQDHYLEHEYDLSKVIFIATANYYENIPAPLLDRVEIIQLSSYTLTEKINIAKTHLIPKVILQSYLDKEFFQIDDETIAYIIKHYTKEAGVRGLKRIFDKIARKIVLKTMEDSSIKQFVITQENIEELLGTETFKDELEEDIDIPGIVNGLAFTSVGGSTLQIEVNTFKGKPEIKLTGSLKEVMQESAQIALSYVRSNAEKFGISDFDFEKNTIHIHVPEGAVPKDGPSAGVTFTTALISALSQRVVSHKIGMTGEITLRGKVLEIGGLKEKSFAASQKGIEYVFIPEGNIKNLKDIPNEIKSTIKYIPVKCYDEIYDVIFEQKEPKTIIEFKEN